MSGRGRGVSNAPAWLSRQAIPHENVPSSSNNNNNNNNSSPKNKNALRSRSRSRSPPRDSYGRRRLNDDRGGSRAPPPRGGGYEDHPPYRHPSRGGGGGYRGGGGGGGYGRDYGRRGGGPPPPPGPHRGGGGGRYPPRHYRRHEELFQFHSEAEERDWLEDRRRSRRSRKSFFDVPPTPEQVAMELAQAQALASLEAAKDGKLPMTAPSPYCTTVPKKYATGVAPQPQQTRHARRLYIGQLPLDVNEAEVHQFFKECIRVAMEKKEDDKEEDPILSVYINRERRFSFVEFRTMEVCTACLALDGINLLGKGKVKVKRPNDYNPALAMDTPVSSSLNFDVSRLGIVSGSVPDGPNKIFIGGLPYHLTEDQVLELLGAFGQVRAFHLVKADNLASTSKGYCFVEYSDPAVTPVAVVGLNGMAMGADKILSARMAAARGTTPTEARPSIATEQEEARARMNKPGVDVEALLNVALDGATLLPPEAAATPVLPVTRTRVLVLLNMVTDEDLATDEEYAELIDEVKEECSKFGKLLSMKIPRSHEGYGPTSIKKVFLEYATVQDAAGAEKELAGRQFGPNVVQAEYLHEQDFAAGNLK